MHLTLAIREEPASESLLRGDLWLRIEMKSSTSRSAVTISQPQKCQGPSPSELTLPARRNQTPLELSQEAQVVLPELTDVIDGVLQHRDPLRS